MADFNLQAVLEFVNKAGRGTKDATKDLKGLDKAANDTKKSTSGLEKGVQGLQKALAALAAREVIRVTWELAQLGAQADAVDKRFVAMAGGAQQAEEFMRRIRVETNYAVDEMAAMASVSRLLQMGLVDTADAGAEMITMAINLGDQTKSAQARIEDWSLFLSNQASARADNFGMAAGALRQRVQELKAEFPAMTSEIAFSTAVMEQGRQAMDRLGDATDNQMTTMMQFDAVVADAKTSMGTFVANALMPAVEGFVLLTTKGQRVNDMLADHTASSLEAGKAWEEYNRQQLEAQGIADKGTFMWEMQRKIALETGQMLHDVTSNYNEFNLVVEEAARLGLTYGETLDQVTYEALRNAQATDVAAQGFRDMGASAQEAGPLIAGAAGAGTRSMEDYKNSMVELQGQSEETTARIVLGFVQQAAAADGVITNDELDVMAALAEKWGLVDDASVTAMGAARGAVDNLNAGLYETDDAINAIDGALRNLPTEHTMRIHLDVDDLNLPGWSVPASIDIGDRNQLPGAGTRHSLGDERERGQAPTPNAAGAIPQAEGGDWMVTRPTLFLAGEAGPERATFTPLRAGAEETSRGGDTYILNIYTSAPANAQTVASGFETLKTLRGG